MRRRPGGESLDRTLGPRSAPRAARENRRYSARERTASRTRKRSSSRAGPEARSELKQGVRASRCDVAASRTLSDRARRALGRRPEPACVSAVPAFVPQVLDDERSAAGGREAPARREGPPREDSRQPDVVGFPLRTGCRSPSRCTWRHPQKQTVEAPCGCVPGKRFVPRSGYSSASTVLSSGPSSLMTRQRSETTHQESRRSCSMSTRGAGVAIDVRGEQSIGCAELQRNLRPGATMHRRKVDPVSDPRPGITTVSLRVVPSPTMTPMPMASVPASSDPGALRSAPAPTDAIGPPPTRPDRSNRPAAAVSPRTSATSRIEPLEVLRGLPNSHQNPSWTCAFKRPSAARRK
jgi:hypothetical protein